MLNTLIHLDSIFSNLYKFFCMTWKFVAGKHNLPMQGSQRYIQGFVLIGRDDFGGVMVKYFMQLQVKYQQLWKTVFGISYC